MQVSGASFTFAGSILQLRGSDPVSTPLYDPITGNVLLFNGEIFSGLDIPSGSNDSIALLTALSTSLRSTIPEVLSSLRGPWSCVFWQAETNTLWFGRDVLGRRSLLVHWPRSLFTSLSSLSSSSSAHEGHAADDDAERNGDAAGHSKCIAGSEETTTTRSNSNSGKDYFILTSVGPLDPLPPFEENDAEFEEVEPGIYKIDFSSDGVGVASEGCSEKEDDKEEEEEKRDAFSRIKKESVVAVSWTDADIAAVRAFHRPVEFIDPVEDDDDVKNSCFPSQPPPPRPTTVDAQACVDSVLCVLRHAVHVRCRCIDSLSSSLMEKNSKILLPLNSSTSSSSSTFETVKEEEKIQGTIPPPPPPPPLVVLKLKPAKIMILFSGGVDSTLLAALAHEVVPSHEPIDLVSICFAEGTSPDRLSALDAFEELQEMAPQRHWRLIATNKTLADVDAARSHLLRLLSPADTVMDLNIGAALWLAAAGEGIILRSSCAAELSSLLVNNQEESKDGGGNYYYRSAARCVLLGHGADELFGGYGRHRTRFRDAGWHGLSDELALDVNRLWVRNLGRDDRLIADRGREARHPFLDESLVLESLRWPLCMLSDLRRPPGEGDKMVLRQSLRRLGLPRAGQRVKRAIQFGTRLARAVNVAQFGGTNRANARSAGSVRLGDVGVVVVQAAA